jgi:hypothetical protein
MRKHGLARDAHMFGSGIVARCLERVIGFHRAREIDRTAVVLRPAAVRLRCLDGAQVTRHLLLQHIVDFIHVMHHQDVFGGDRAVGLQLKAPVSVLVLMFQQRHAATFNGLIQTVRL